MRLSVVLEELQRGERTYPVDPDLINRFTRTGLGQYDMRKLITLGMMADVTGILADTADDGSLDGREKASIAADRYIRLITRAALAARDVALSDFEG